MNIGDIKMNKRIIKRDVRGISCVALGITSPGSKSNNAYNNAYNYDKTNNSPDKYVNLSMKKIISMDNTFAIECLKKDVETKLSRQLLTPSDFKFLSLQIQRLCNEQISAHTLMRIWGYLNTNSKPSTHTLSVLCRFIGYNSLPHYTLDLNTKKSEGSTFTTTDTIAVSTLHPGDTISLGWKPDRSITLLYLGNFKFRVISNKNSRLKVGDELQCVSFAKGIPFVASMANADRGEKEENERKVSYIGGKDGGLTSLAISRNND